MKIQTMSFGLPEGGHVLMHWPDCVEPESVDMLLECVTLQCKSMRRAAEVAKEARKKAEEEAHNVEVTGAAQLYRAASGVPQGYVSDGDTR